LKIEAEVAGSGHAPEPALTLVIPAYNEANRIDDTVREAVAWIGSQSFSVELIVVDDGSEDDTVRIAEAALLGFPNGRVVRCAHAGKAAAVRAGMRAAKGEQIAFSDADLATPLLYVLDLRAALSAGADIAIGSREGRYAVWLQALSSRSRPRLALSLASLPEPRASGHGASRNRV
jgi:glycosyltransferase involved in cell wall biosynthesis